MQIHSHHPFTNTATTFTASVLSPPLLVKTSARTIRKACVTSLWPRMRLICLICVKRVEYYFLQNWVKLCCHETVPVDLPGGGEVPDQLIVQGEPLLGFGHWTSPQQISHCHRTGWQCFWAAVSVVPNPEALWSWNSPGETRHLFSHCKLLMNRFEISLLPEITEGTLYHKSGFSKIDLIDLIRFCVVLNLFC